MNISINKVVSLSYELKTAVDGEIIEKVDNTQPLTFIYGIGSMLPKFEENIFNLKTGDKFDFKLESIDAYGEYSEEAIVDVPKKAFMQDGKLNEDIIFMNNIVPLQDNQGNRFNGKIIGISPENVTFDLNHPLADKELFFKGEVVEIREATQEEINHGHPHHECTGCGKH